MLHLFDDLESELRQWTTSPEGWQSLDITYHPPRVERLFRQHGSLRVAIHRIHPCEPEEGLYHPHPWPMATRLLTGGYEMGFGFGPGTVPPPLAGRMVLSAPARYEMLHRDAWHSVSPSKSASLSIMITGTPWERAMPSKPSVAQEALSPSAVAEILALAHMHL